MHLDLNLPQLKASDPNISVWTMASAGTGKTKVLIDRLMKLLVKGANPKKILCLTFTKAAANEIKIRINQEIEKWSKSNDDELSLLLLKLFGFSPKKQFLNKAKNLLNELFKSPEPIKICTIHAFCQYVLKKFPVEAGISPTFKIIDELLMRQVIAKLKKELFFEQSCKNAIKFFAQNFHETTIDEILHEIVSGKFLSLTDSFSDAQTYKKYLSKKIGIPMNSAEEIVQSYVLNIPIKEQISLKSEHLKDAETINSVNSYLSLSLREKIRRWRNLNGIFLTADQNERVSILSKKTRDQNPHLAELLEKWQTNFANLTKEIANNTALNASCYLYEIAESLLAKYQSFKVRNEYLDYEDLVFFTNKLLSKSTDKDWVLYKLDGGIDHILVDEAQDTSASQWQVIQNLISDFFSGESRHNDRTIFVVGDEKQSIYSFQGADIEALQSIKHLINSGMKNANKDYKNVQLTNCYRSTQVIVDFIQKSLNQSSASFRVPDVRSMRSTNIGRVELWPMLPTQLNQKKDTFWPDPTQTYAHESNKVQLSRIIASYVKNLLSKKIILPSTKAAIKESDITILVQRRNAFTDLLIDSLRKEGLYVCGLDRIKLQSNLSILDVMAVAKFVLLPSDNLNCAIVLKSPLFNLEESELHEIVCGEIIWNNLSTSTKASHREIFSKMQEILQLYKNCSISDFFLLLLDYLGLRNLLLKTNCKSDDQVIDEFLQVTKRFENEIGGSLYTFVDWFENNELQVKREHLNEEGIKIMTVHAAKGLESSVVILPNATSLNMNENRICWIQDDCVLFLPRDKSHLITSYKSLEQEKSYQEYLRLMYVALSRCKDYLIICSDSSHKEAHKDSWYSIASNAIKQLGVSVKSEILEELGLKENIWVLQSQEFEICINNEEVNAINVEEPPALQKWSSKHNAVKISSHVSSPLEEGNKSALYGSIVHKLLEEAANGAPSTEIFNHPLLSKFSLKKRTETVTKLKNLFYSAFWQDLLKNKVYTEVPFFDYKEDKSIFGRIDLLMISESEVRIVDYKTDAFVPKSEKDIPKKYLEQMHRYKAAISKIYPNHKVSCQILWFESSKFTQLDDFPKFVL